MSVISSLQTSFGIGAYASPIGTIRQLHPDEQPFVMSERHGKKATYGSVENSREESTDLTGIKISEETRQFLEQKALEERAKENKDLTKVQNKQKENAEAEQLNNEEVEPESEEMSQVQLTEEEKEAVKDLEARDAEVKAHEQAHMAAGAGLTSGPKYDYTVGPDGKQYAVGGSVQIDTSSDSSDPDATITKADKIRAAAMAPASPSAQDYAVANAANQMKAEAKKQKAEEASSDRIGNEEQESGNADKSARNESISAQSVLKSSEPNSASLLNAVGMYAQYNKPLQSQEPIHLTSSLESPKNTESFAVPLTAAAISSTEKTMKSSNSAMQNHEQWKQYAVNAYSQVQTRAFARASSY